MKNQLEHSIINLLTSSTKSEELQITRVVRKAKLIRGRQDDEKWALIIRTDSNSESKNMEFFTLVDSITFDTYPDIRPGMTVKLCYYPDDILIKKGNIIIQADEIWIEKKRKPKGEKRKVQSYDYKEDPNRDYYSFEGDMPDKIKNDEMYLFKEKWTQP